MSALNTQIAGSHYRNMKIQPVEFIHANGLGFLEGCIVKRICRFRAKNGREDLEKIKHEIDLLIELEYGKQVDPFEADMKRFYPDMFQSAPPAPPTTTGSTWQPEVTPTHDNPLGLRRAPVDLAKVEERITSSLTNFPDKERAAQHYTEQARQAHEVPR